MIGITKSISGSRWAGLFMAAVWLKTTTIFKRLQQFHAKTLRLNTKDTKLSSRLCVKTKKLLNREASIISNLKYKISNQPIFSITIALAPPPPLQIPAAPYFALFAFNTLINVTMILAPLAPNG